MKCVLENNIKQLLNEQGRKANYLAKRVGITDSHLSGIINRRIIPGADIALKIAQALGVKFEKVFYFSGNQEEERIRNGEKKAIHNS